MHWNQLTKEAQIIEIIEQSASKTQVIFKHSTRCSVSTMAKNRLEKHTFPTNADFYYLDLIAHRNISNKIAEQFNVWHESPQVLIIKQGECTYDESHSGINWQELTEAL